MTIALPTPATVFTLNGLGDTRDMSGWLNGAFQKPGYTVRRVAYPASMAADSIATGVRMVNDAMATPGVKIFFAHSQGAQVIAHWIAAHKDDPAAPPAAEVVLVLVGNPLRNPGGAGIGVGEFGGTVGKPTPDSQYRTIDVARSRDGWAVPLPWWQSWWGRFFVHPHYERTDLNAPGNTVLQRGNTTLVITA